MLARIGMSHSEEVESEKVAPVIVTTPNDFRQVRKGPVATDVYLTDVLLLCTECGEPIKGRINTPQWIRVEWIGPEGECLKCYHGKKNETLVTKD